jgi:hypothetical protein
MMWLMPSAVLIMSLCDMQRVCNLEAGEVSLQGQQSRLPTNARTTGVAHRHPVLRRRSDITVSGFPTC